MLNHLSCIKERKRFFKTLSIKDALKEYFDSQDSCYYRRGNNIQSLKKNISKTVNTHREQSFLSCGAQQKNY